jgi:flagellar protein FlaJ
MELKKNHKIGIAIGILIIALAFLFKESVFFIIILGMGIIIGTSPFVFSIILETKKANEKEEMFLEFARNLVESVKMGSPISKSIINVKGKDYGALTQHIQKLANQISLGIPLNKSLQTFADDINNKKISRSIILIRQAERAGGNIGEILESVAEAVSMSDKLKKERKSSISNLVVQGYIIFFVFMIIILIMQFKILPMLSGIAGMSNLEGISSSSEFDIAEIANSFLYLLLIQGFFSGLTIGKLAEGNIKAGIKHSFILMLFAFVISSGANILIGG